MSLFKISGSDFGNQRMIKLINTSSGESLSILPETGGILHQIEYHFGNKLVAIMDNYKNEEQLLNEVSLSFKGCNLFPFANRIKDGTFNFEGINYQLDKNFHSENNACHGLVYNKPFRVIAMNVDHTHAQLELQYIADGLDKGYPFTYKLNIIYSLDQNSRISIQTSIKNIDTKNMPFTHGWHPYFCFGTSIDLLDLSIPTNKQVMVDEQMIPTGHFANYNHFTTSKMIKNKTMDTSYKLVDTDGILASKLFNPLNGNGINIWQKQGENQYNFVHVFTPVDRKSIAIEPSTSIPNALNNDSKFLVLNPDHEISFEWGIEKLVL